MHSLSPTAESQASREASRSLARWECLTRQALDAHRLGRLELALAAHVQALWTVEALLDGPVLALRPDDCLAALVVSHHNLADLYRCRGQSPQAVDHLCLPHGLLLRLAGDAQVPPDVGQAAWRHLRETRAQLLAWQRAHGPLPAIDAALEAAPACVSDWASRAVPRLH